tara:strand:- start:33 stop:290 length:258 start_codon:yes stop_codon:yes gene_type:complete
MSDIASFIKHHGLFVPYIADIFFKFENLGSAFTAKALAGNLGAQLTVMRDKAEGKIIDIYFDIDNKFYKVTLSTFNPLDHKFKLI